MMAAQSDTVANRGWMSRGSVYVLEETVGHVFCFSSHGTMQPLQPTMDQDTFSQEVLYITYGGGSAAAPMEEMTTGQLQHCIPLREAATTHCTAIMIPGLLLFVTDGAWQIREGFCSSRFLHWAILVNMHV